MSLIVQLYVRTAVLLLVAGFAVMMPSHQAGGDGAAASVHIKHAKPANHPTETAFSGLSPLHPEESTLTCSDAAAQKSSQAEAGTGNHVLFLPVATKLAIGGNIANCRYGATPLSNDQAAWIPSLGAGWYITFSASRPTTHNNNVQFVPVIRVKQAKDAQGNYLPQYLIGPQGLTGNAARDYIISLVSSNPGSLWLVGNEVDRGPDPGQIHSGQGDVMPNIYAWAYHDVYYWIKAADPTAQVAVSGLVQVTPGRLQYLDLVLAAYQQQYNTTIPVDVWNMHLYILPEVTPGGQPNGIANVALGTDPAIAKRESGGDPTSCPNGDVYCFAEHDDMAVFAEQIVAMRTWMKQRGQQNKPLILTEYSLLYPYITFPDGSCDFLRDEYGNCFTPVRVSQFMANSFNYLETAIDPDLGYPLDNYRLVQQWMWFSAFTSSNTGNVSNLLTAPGSYQSTLTPLGQQFMQAAMSTAAPANLLVEQVTSPVVSLPANSTTVDVNISVTLRNNGDSHVRTPFTVTFYADAAMTQVIGSTTVTPIVYGCATDPYTATITWPGLPVGQHSYWVRLDSQNNVAEVTEVDNVAQGMVQVNPVQTLLSINN